MATATTNSSVPCVITYGPSLDSTGIEWVEITNVETKGKRTLDLKSQNLDPRRFRRVWAEVWTLICNTTTGDTVEMTADQRQAFAEMCKFRPVSDAAQKHVTVAEKVVLRNEVRRTAINSVSLQDAEQRLNGLNEVVQKVTDDTYILLQYDIPAVLASVCPNPSRLLWSLGFRMTLSCWVLPSKNLDRQIMKELFSLWTENNVLYRVLPFAEAAMQQIRQMALDAVNEEIRRIHVSLIDAIANADETLREAVADMDAREANGSQVGEKERSAAEQKMINAKRTNIRIAGDALNAAVSCAATFENTDSVSDLLKSVREALKAQAIAFNEIAKERGLKKVRI